MKKRLFLLLLIVSALSGFSQRKMIVNGNRHTIPAVLSDGNTVGWYIASNLASVTKDGANLVSQWNDLSGFSHNLSDTYGSDPAFAPTWSASGITFDGVFNYMNTTFTLVQPEFIYVVISINSTSPDFTTVINGVGSSSGFYATSMATTPTLVLSSGSDAASNTSGSANTFMVVRALLNGASSKLIVNSSSTTTGNPGANNMSGITIASNIGPAYAGSHSKIQIKELIVRKISDVTADEAAIYGYLKAKYGL